MSSDEAIDRVDATGTFMEVSTRETIHRLGHWHQVFHCLIIRRTHRPTVVLQRRSPHSRSFPNRLDLSATGHLLAGESAESGVRELQEELGVEVDPRRLVPVGTRLLADNSGEGKNRERINVFLLEDNRALNEYNPDTSEVQSLVEIEIENLLELLATTQSTVEGTEWRGGTAHQTITVSVDDLVDQVDAYWLVLMIMAQRFIAGDRPIAI